MKKSYVYMVVIVVAILAAGGIWYGVAHKNTNNNMGSMNMSGSSSKTSNQAPTATNMVTIQNFAFSPANITVKKGTSVTWTNKDSTAHTVTETDGQTGPNSRDVNPGSSYSFTF